MCKKHAVKRTFCGTDPDSLYKSTLISSKASLLSLVESHYSNPRFIECQRIGSGNDERFFLMKVSVGISLPESFRLLS
jgi:hypothetical protein